MAVSIHPSGRKHQRRDRLTDDDILHAAESWEYASTPDDEVPANEFRLGFETRGRLLELQVLKFDSGDELIIHAMKARKQYPELLD
ncbi:MAG TPA: toxin [Mycobacterium sp.]